jgi:hypothetical protein
MVTEKILARRVLTYTFVVFLFCIGLDKVVQINLITNWQLLVGPVIHFSLPFSLRSVVMIEGGIEVLLGILLLTPWKKYSLAVLVVTILLVTTDLFILRYYDLAVHEIIFIAVLVAIYLLDQEPAHSAE